MLPPVAVGVARSYDDVYNFRLVMTVTCHWHDTVLATVPKQHKIKYTYKTYFISPTDFNQDFWIKSLKSMFNIPLIFNISWTVYVCMWASSKKDTPALANPTWVSWIKCYRDIFLYLKFPSTIWWAKILTMWFFELFERDLKHSWNLCFFTWLVSIMNKHGP